MIPPCFAKPAAVRVESSHHWGRLTAAVVSVVCLWAFSADSAPPPNDNRANATVVVPVGTALRLTTASNVDATKESGEPNHAGNAGGKSIWFRYTPTVTAFIAIDTVGTEFDTILGIYRTNALTGALELVGSSDDAFIDFFALSGGYHQGRVIFAATNGVTHFFAVDGFNDGSGAASGPVVLNFNQFAGAPANNAFNSPILLTGTQGAFSGRNVGATEEGGEPNHAGNVGGRSVWYRWTAPVTGEAVVDNMGSSFDTLMAVYTGTAFNNLALVAASDDVDPQTPFGRVRFNAVSGITYQIVVDGYNNGPGAFNGSLALHYSLFGTAPANDNFLSSQVIAGSEGRVTGRSHMATAEVDEPLKGGSPGGRSVWYSWTAPATAQTTIDTYGIWWDNLLGVFTGNDLATLTPVVSNDDSFPGANTASRVSFMATAGTTYRIVVDGYSEAGVPADYGPFSLNWEQAVNAPANDLFASAMMLAGNRGTVSINNTNAVFEQGEPINSLINNTYESLSGKTLWFSWTVNHSRDVTLSTVGSSFDTVMAVYTGTDFGNFAIVANNDDMAPGVLTSSITFPGVAGTTYHIVVDGYHPATGRGAANGQVVLNYFQPGGPPDNDNLEDGFVLTGLAGSTNGFSFDATPEDFEPDHAQFQATVSSWYRWTAPVSGWFTFDTLGSPLDTVLAIYTGTEMLNLNEVGSNSDIDPGIPIIQSRVTFLASSGVTYQIAVDGTFGAQGDFVLNWVPTAILSAEIIGGNLHLTLKVADGDMYNIQESTDFVMWPTVQTVSAGGGPVTIDLGPIAGMPKKFYRAIQAP